MQVEMWTDFAVWALEVSTLWPKEKGCAATVLGCLGLLGSLWGFASGPPGLASPVVNYTSVRPVLVRVDTAMALEA